jgi:hypothetical protein
MNTASPNATEFILSQDPIFDNAQVAELGHQAGYSFSAKYVSNIRRLDKSKKKGNGTIMAGKTAAKKVEVAATKKNGKTNKAAFVRQYAGKSAKEVVALGKAAGFNISTAHVYAIRSKDNLEKKTKKATKKLHDTTHVLSKPNGVVSVSVKKNVGNDKVLTVVGSGGHSPRQLLIAAAVGVGGFDKAVAILNDVVARIEKFTAELSS